MLAFLTRVNHALCCIVEGPTADQRRTNYAKRSSLTVLKDGSLWELLEYVITDQKTIDDFDRRAWSKCYALAHAPVSAFKPGRKAVAFTVITPPLALTSVLA